MADTHLPVPALPLAGHSPFGLGFLVPFLCFRRRPAGIVALLLQLHFGAFFLAVILLLCLKEPRLLRRAPRAAAPSPISHRNPKKPGARSLFSFSEL